MRLLDNQAPWLSNLAISPAGIATGGNGRFGIGALLVVNRAGTCELLLARKSFRPGYEGNNQFAFPGGMIRPRRHQSKLTHWIQDTLATRVAAEVGLELNPAAAVRPFHVTPPVVARYTVHGSSRHTVILPFVLASIKTFVPATEDSTVYAPGWYNPIGRWGEITATNRLIAAYYLWPRLSQAERWQAMPSLEEAFEQAAGWAAELKLPAPPSIGNSEP